QRRRAHIGIAATCAVVVAVGPQRGAEGVGGLGQPWVPGRVLVRVARDVLHLGDVLLAVSGTHLGGRGVTVVGPQHRHLPGQGGGAGVRRPFRGRSRFPGASGQREQCGGKNDTGSGTHATTVRSSRYGATMPSLDLRSDPVDLTAALVDIESVSGAEAGIADAAEAALRAQAPP